MDAAFDRMVRVMPGVKNTLDKILPGHRPLSVFNHGNHSFLL
jgi:hypothetical protein